MRKERIGHEVCELNRRIGLLEQRLSMLTEGATASGRPSAVPPAFFAIDPSSMHGQPMRDDQRIVGKYATVRGEQGWESLFPPGPSCRITVDATTNDDGFLTNAFNGYYGARYVNDLNRHTTTEQAFSSLRGGTADFSVLVGHGDPGTINTGSGQVSDGPDKYMSAVNQSSWSPFASPGVPGSRLVLFGCSVAAGGAGTRFLQLVANTVRKEVGGWDGLCYSGTENGYTRVWGTGNFLVAQPGGRLKPVEIPELYEGTTDIQSIKIRTAEDNREIPLDSIVAVSFTPIGSLPERYSAINVRGPDANALLGLIDFENPIITDDKLCSILVGQFVITFEFQGKTHSRAFRVLGYSVLQDTCFPNTYYYTSSKLRKVLTGDEIAP